MVLLVDMASGEQTNHCLFIVVFCVQEQRKHVESCAVENVYATLEEVLYTVCLHSYLVTESCGLVNNGQGWHSNINKGSEDCSITPYHSLPDPGWQDWQECLFL